MRASKSGLWGRFEIDRLYRLFMRAVACTGRQIFTASSPTILSIIRVYQAGNPDVKSAVAMPGIDHGDNDKGYVW